MSDYVQVNPDNIGKKVETIPFTDSADPTQTVHRQTTSLGPFRIEQEIRDTLILIRSELRAMRLIICNETRQHFEEVPNIPL